MDMYLNLSENVQNEVDSREVVCKIQAYNEMHALEGELYLCTTIL